MQTSGNGCALLDADGDGNLDLLLVGRTPGLFLGDGHGKFRDVSAVWGLSSLSGSFLGCAVGDVDGDGHSDVYLSGYREGRLLRNVGGHRFEDVTTSWGLKPQPWGTSAAFVDVDRDGWLDLVICNYLQFRADSLLALCFEAKVDGKDIYASCPPTVYKPLASTLWRNDGGKRFVAPGSGWKLTQNVGNALGVAVADYDDDGWPDLALACDMVASDLFHNEKGASLKNVATTAGTALSAEGRPYAGMGIDWGDYDNDGRLDLALTAFENQSKPLYHNDGDGVFTDRALAAGLEPAMRDDLSFGCKFLDADNDGWLDLIFANGHVADEIARFRPTQTFRQYLRFFHGSPTGRFRDDSEAGGLRAVGPLLGRGLCTGDFDNDGLVDVVVADSEGTPHLLHNESRKKNHWLGVRLIGTRSGTNAYGARLTLTFADGAKLLRVCRADGSYLSSSDPRVVFGLGDKIATSLRVRWPSGGETELSSPPRDAYLTIEEEGASLVR